jgi:hypothetical protein
MRAAKRQWIYAGLAVPAGVALVRRSALGQSAAPPGFVLLVGDERALAIAAPLEDLTSASPTQLAVRVRPGSSASDWAVDGSFTDDLRRMRPDVVLFALPVDDPRSVAALVARARRGGAAPWWLPPPGRTVLGAFALPAPLWVVSSSRPMSVGTYAAWAGAIWRSLGRGKDDGGRRWAGN